MTRGTRVPFLLAALLLAFLALAGPASAADPLFRVNAGGDAVTDSTPWLADTVAAPSPYVNAVATKNKVTATTAAIDTSDPSVPAGTPASIFQDERWDPVGNKEMSWAFSVLPGRYKVNLYFVENYAANFAVGKRMFNVAIEGQTVLPNFDVYAAAGAGNKGIVKSFTVNADTTLNVDFTHGAIDNPAIAAIEVVPVVTTVAPPLNASPDSAAVDTVTTGQTATQTITLTNGAAAGGQSIVVNSTSITGTDAASFSDNYDDTAHTLAPGASLVLTVTLAPTTAGAKSATLVVAHSGSNAPLNIPLTGTAVAPTTPGTYQVNAGGAAITGPPAWSQDTIANPSPYSNSLGTKNKTSSTGTTMTFDPSVPSGTQAAVFRSDRWDPPAGKEMQWSFPTISGTQYQVKLYFAETYAPLQAVGARIFNVAIDGTTRLSNYDIFADVGANRGVVKTFTITSDGTTNIDFGHVADNPKVNAIEVIPVSGPGAPTITLGTTPSSLSFGTVTNGATKTLPVTLKASGGPVTINNTTITGSDAGDFTDNFDDSGQVTLQDGQTLNVNVSFHPVVAGTKTATLNINHNGVNSPLSVSLSAAGESPPTGGGTQVGFGKSLLKGESSSAPTALAFGPDGRLYVAQFNGSIWAYTITRNSANDYSVSNAEQINLIRQIPNHDDDGSVNLSVTTRLITGIYVAGTSLSPVIYATSSDPRIGTYGGDILPIDTNSSMVSKIYKNGMAWARQDLVRGLPRSKENHSANGLTLDAATNMLYVGISGNTNAGGPSTAFGYLPEYAMGNGILQIDLNQIGGSTYDLPTLDDESRPGVHDANDPFGGDNGKNQATYQSSGPVTFYAKGLRNPYKVIIAANGKMYTVDNGGNAGWGGPPANEGPAGNCTNEVVTGGTSINDKLFLVTQGAYLGHPNPTRGNMGNTFNTSNPQSPVTASNPIECDFMTGAEAGALTEFTDSTNGFTEYTASNFGGAMKGDFIAPLYNGNSINRVDMNSAGTAVNANTTLFNTVGQRPLDIASQGDTGPFRGDLFVADLAIDGIVVYEPNDFNGSAAACTGAYSKTIDEDNDGYTNADEIDNGTNPCSAADTPPDHDKDGISDLNDPDDDNDGVLDVNDAFAIDGLNGLNNALPTALTFDNNQVAGGLLGLNFTGLMTNGTTDWRTQYDGTKMTAGGAGGLVTVDQVPAGDATGSTNTQQYAFQVGVKPGTSTQWTAQARTISPFAGLTLQDSMSQGFYIGTGDQDNYIKVVASANGGAGGITVVREINGVVTSSVTSTVGLTGRDYVDLYLTYDPATGTVQPAYRPTTTGAHGTRVNMGPPLDVPSAWLTSADKGMALGIIATSAGAASPFPASWDFIRAVAGDGSDV